MNPKEQKGKQIGQGYTAEVFDWGFNSDKILKLYRKNLPEFLCIHEFNATKQVYNQLQICPRAYEMIEIDGRKGAVYEKIIGKTMLKGMLSKIWEMKKLARKLAQIHFSIQQKGDFELPAVKEKLKRNIKPVAELSDDEKTYLYQYIDKLPDGNCLCHFDFHPDNIMLQNGKAIIIDWMTAAKGDPLADIARTSLLLKYGEIQVKSKTIQNLINTIKQKILKEYRKEYLRITDVKQEAIDVWELPIAAARLCEWIPIHEKQILLNLIHRRIKESSN